MTTEQEAIEMIGEEKFKAVVEGSNELEAILAGHTLEVLKKCGENNMSTAASILMTAYAKALGAVIAMNRDEEQRKNLIHLAFAGVSRAVIKTASELEELQEQRTNIH